MNNAIKIFIFVLLTIAFYSYVGQMVPQKITYPPQSTELSADLTPAQLAAAGEEIASGKGTCLTCHTIGSPPEGLRFPDLGGIGSRAASQKAGMSDVEYLAESMYDPNAFVVEGFLAGMPSIGGPPINLTDNEILAVLAYLQSLGGEPTVTLDTVLPWQRDESEQPVSAPATAATAPGAGLDGPGVFAAYACSTCHAINDDTRMVGPSLYDVGSRLTTAEIYEAIMDPDATVAEGYPGAAMKAMLDGTGFYQKVSTEELKALVDHLASQTGN